MTQYKLINSPTPVKNFAQRHEVIVIATIHQPNWETFSLFDKLLLLAQGRTMFFGATGDYLLKSKCRLRLIRSYYRSTGYIS